MHSIDHRFSNNFLLCYDRTGNGLEVCIPVNVFQGDNNNNNFTVV